MKEWNKEARRGFVPLARRFFDHPLWQETREFSRAEAWLDLIASARFEGGKGERLIGGRLVKWDRGELPTSVRFLQQRWGWGSKNKVARFLQLLETEGMIERRAEQGLTILRLCQFEAYNAPGGFLRPERDAKGSGARQAQVKVEEPEEGTTTEQRGNAPPQGLEELKARKRAFRQEVERVGGMYEKPLRESFLAYWGETDRAGQMRWEREATWETALRLFRWAQRERKPGSEVGTGPKRLSRVMFPKQERGGS